MKTIVLLLIRLYQKTSFIRKPFLRMIIANEGTCRFNPTCSEYTYQSISQFGVVKGISIGLKQFSKCHPYSKK